MTEPNQIRRWPIWLISAGLAGLASWLFLRGQPAGLPVDDAYIHLVYAQNLAKGLGWCFNPGEPSLGTSSPLWVFLIRCLLPWLTPETAVRVLSLAGLIVSTVIISEIVRVSLPSLGEDRNSRFIRDYLILCSAALFVFSGNLLWIAFCGMETMVFLAFGLLAVHGMATGRPGALTGISLALLVLTRIEGWVLYLVLLGWWLFSERRKGFWFLAPVAAWLAWTVYTDLHFGLLLPSTMSGKLASNLFNSGLSLRGAGLFLWRHLVYLGRWNRGLLAMLVIAFSGYGLSRYRPSYYKIAGQKIIQNPAILQVMVWAVLNLLLHALWFRSTESITPYHYMRYQVSIFAALPLTVIWALVPAMKPLRKDDFYPELERGWRRFAVGVILWGIIGISMQFSVRTWRNLYQENLEHLTQSHRAAALWAKANLPEDARIACFDIGSLKYFSGRYVIDLGGLTDPAIWPYLREKRVGPYLVKARADYYFALDRPPEEVITGVRKDDGALYHLKELARFDAPDYPTPVRLHSLAVIVYKIE